MKKIAKRIQETNKLIKKELTYGVDDAIKLAKKSANAKFKESLDVAIQLGIDAKLVASVHDEYQFEVLTV